MKKQLKTVPKIIFNDFCIIGSLMLFSLATTIKTEERSHIYNDPDCYSLLDFINVKNNKMFKRLTELKKLCENHVNSCQVRVF